MTIRDIYRSILSSLDVKVVSEIESVKAREATFSANANVKAVLPLFGGGNAGIDSELKGITEARTKEVPIEINLEIPNDLSRIIKEIAPGKFIILENFHYLSEEMQRKLAFDLRSFQELGVRFIILGVWREKNRLTQFNGDLLDRIIEVPVEPWKRDEFENVISKGSKHLNIEFDQKITHLVIENAFDSIGVVQELIRTICKLKNVMAEQSVLTRIDDASLVDSAIKEKVQEYSSRHTRALESIAEGRKSRSGSSEGLIPLYHLITR